MTLWLIEHLQGQGLSVGVISRGYGGQPPSVPWQVNPMRDEALQTGDEPLLIARRSQVPVVVDPKRSNAAQHLLDHHPIDVIISDDGLQHYPMGRTLELVMIDDARGLGNQRCLPEARCANLPPECIPWISSCATALLRTALTVMRCNWCRLNWSIF